MIVDSEHAYWASRLTTEVRLRLNLIPETRNLNPKPETGQGDVQERQEALREDLAACGAFAPPTTLPFAPPPPCFSSRFSAPSARVLLRSFFLKVSFSPGTHSPFWLALPKR